MSRIMQTAISFYGAMRAFTIIVAAVLGQIGCILLYIAIIGLLMYLTCALGMYGLLLTVPLGLAAAVAMFLGMAKCFDWGLETCCKD